MNDTRIVADAGPLIVLARTGHLDVLERQFAPIVMPHAIHAECTAAPGKPGALAIEAAIQQGRIVVQAPARLRDVPLGPRVIDKGETEGILLALELGSPILLDDKSARQAAKAAGLAVIGTAGLLLAGKMRGIVPAVAPVLEAFSRHGYHLSAELVAAVLERAGERRR